MDLVTSENFQCFYIHVNFHNFFSFFFKKKRTVYHLSRDVKISQNEKRIQRNQNDSFTF